MTRPAPQLSPPSGVPLRQPAGALELALLAAWGVGLSMYWSQNAVWVSNAIYGLPQLVAGTAMRPFVYRVLAPILVRGLMRAGVALLPAAMAVTILSFIGWMWAMRWLAGLLGLPRPLLAALASAGPVCILFSGGSYLYDPPTLALFTLALALMASNRWRAYALLFPLVVLCRETAILLPVVFFVWKGPRWRLLSYQLAVFGAIHLALVWLYRNNPGGEYYTHWREHVTYLLQDPAVNILLLGLYGGCLAVALKHWRAQPAFLRSAAVIIPVMFAVYWLVGFPGELRVCLEAYPVLFLLTWNGVAEVLAPNSARLMSLLRRAPKEYPIA